MKSLFSITMVLILSACGPGQPKPSPSSGSTALGSGSTAQTIKIQQSIPYQKGAPIAANIKTECPLNTQLSEHTQTYGKEYNLNIVRVSQLDKNAAGKVLLVEINDAVSAGNAFIGHQKFVRISGTLYENGKKISSYSARRVSGGGFWGAYKGSCTVLNRTVKALGKDTTLWLSNPVDGSHLGDNN